MARAVHRVGLVVMPMGVEEVCDGEGVLEGLRRVGVVVGGRGRVERGDVRFYSSGLGGFRVACPVDGRVVTAGFVRALEGWRRGGERGTGCGCGGWHRLEDLQFRPECRFAQTAVVLVDVEDVELSEAAWEVVRQVWGGGRVLVQRG